MAPAARPPHWASNAGSDNLGLCRTFSHRHNILSNSSGAYRGKTTDESQKGSSTYLTPINAIASSAPAGILII
jgi:hypothetical protein